MKEQIAKLKIERNERNITSSKSAQHGMRPEILVSEWSSPASSASRDATAAASVAAGRPSAAPGPQLRRTCRRLPVTKYPTARAFTVCSILRGASTIYPLTHTHKLLSGSR